jgi:hypothetical protein
VSEIDRNPPKPSELRVAFQDIGLPEQSWAWVAITMPSAVRVAWDLGRDCVEAELDRLDAAERAANKGKSL